MEAAASAHTSIVPASAVSRCQYVCALSDIDRGSLLRRRQRYRKLTARFNREFRLSAIREKRRAFTTAFLAAHGVQKFGREFLHSRTEERPQLRTCESDERIRSAARHSPCIEPRRERWSRARRAEVLWARKALTKLNAYFQRTLRADPQRAGRARRETRRSPRAALTARF